MLLINYAYTTTNKWHTIDAEYIHLHSTFLYYYNISQLKHSLYILKILNYWYGNNNAVLLNVIVELTVDCDL